MVNDVGDGSGGGGIIMFIDKINLLLFLHQVEMSIK